MPLPPRRPQTHHHAPTSSSPISTSSSPKTHTRPAATSINSLYTPSIPRVSSSTSSSSSTNSNVKPGGFVPKKTTLHFLGTKDMERMDMDLLYPISRSAPGSSNLPSGLSNTSISSSTDTTSTSVGGKVMVVDDLSAGLQTRAKMLAAAKERMQGQVQDLEGEGRVEVGLQGLIDASKGKVRAPRTAVAETLGFETIPPPPQILTLPNAPFPSTSITSPTAIPKSTTMNATTSSSSPRTGHSFLRAMMGMGLSKSPASSSTSANTNGAAAGPRATTPELVPSSLGASGSSIEEGIAATPNSKALGSRGMKTKTSDKEGFSGNVGNIDDAGWERIPSFRSSKTVTPSDTLTKGGNGLDNWVGIETEEDEDLIFWDEPVEEDQGEDHDIDVGSKLEGVSGGKKQVLNYARALKG